MKKQIIIVALASGFFLAPLAFAEAPQVGEIEKLSEIDPLAVTCSFASGRQTKDITGEDSQKSSAGRRKSSQAD